MLLSCSGIENTEVKRIDFPAKATHFDRFVFGERSTRMSVCCVTLTFNFLQVKVVEKLHWLRNVSNYSFEPGQGGHGTGKTGNLVLTFSRQGKHREFCFGTGKILKHRENVFL